MATLVALCSHNGAQYIREQIESIRRQTVPVDSIHVFDFASTDGTLSILNSLEQDGRSPAVRVSRVNHAPGAAMSFFHAFQQMAAISQPSDCIFLSDQDDVWLATKVEEVLNRFCAVVSRQPNRIVAVFHDVAVVDQQLKVLANTYYTGQPFAIPRDLAPDRLLLANPVIGHTIAASGALLKVVAAQLSHTEYLMHDWAAVLVASRLGAVEFVPGVLSLYRQHGGNVLGAYRRRRPTEIVGRTIRFARGLIRQSTAFGRDVEVVWSEVTFAGADVEQLAVDRWLSKISTRAPVLVPFMMAGLALLRGPTWQRRALAGAIILALLRVPVPTRFRP